MNQSVYQIYQTEKEKRGFHNDESQMRAIQILGSCANQWQEYRKKTNNPVKRLLHHGEPPKGIYLYGGVGRGKSFLMDCFFKAATTQRKARLHFHEFLREIHHQMGSISGEKNPLDKIGKKIAHNYDLICFDEFHISDIADAMILYGLLKALFDNHVEFITTSNFHPDELYKNGLQRQRFLPAISLLKEKLTVLNIDNGIDYRTDFLSESGCYFSPDNETAEKSMLQTFTTIQDGPEESIDLEIDNRECIALKRAGGVVWFDFATLCVEPRSQNDFLELADRFHTVMISSVPQMSLRLADAARRFTWLIDVLYDRCVKLIMSAEVVPELLYIEGPLANEFTRTVSRLNEMQSHEYISQAVRKVTTELI